ncbi:hypothetical protein VIGAN_09124500 [Vigna angularis var. angularis]|uniref:Uncharacterized protein n=1 Tax=Vigna angularis var. angularis TaxID=157739 RepID=A0A0S3SXY3_PHAAN|nr:hypothetical protein VIGAN_09124500 [Vigna angularis var. angularis]
MKLEPMVLLSIKPGTCYANWISFIRSSPSVQLLLSSSGLSPHAGALSRPSSLLLLASSSYSLNFGQVASSFETFTLFILSLCINFFISKLYSLDVGKEGEGPPFYQLTLSSSSIPFQLTRP